jgi:anti-anti-sigma factor
MEGALQIAAVAELRDALRESLAESGELTLDLTGVDGCDAAGVQLLLAVRRSAAQASKRLRLVGLEGGVAAAAAALGLPAEALMEAGRGAHTRAV